MSSEVGSQGPAADPHPGPTPPPLHPRPSGAPAAGTAQGTPVVSYTDAELTLGGRVLWQHLSIDIHPGEFIAILGANGAGKTSLLRTLLGEYSLSAGDVRIFGESVSRGDARIGYVPQQTMADPGLPLRARDLVALGVDGRNWGTGLPSAARRARVAELLEAVGATRYARTPVGLLSGGEQQRVRMAQALAGDPALLLCDEPLLSLDVRRQAEIIDLIDSQRARRGFAVLMVTHDVNPVIDYIDRVMYVANGRIRVGTTDEVMRSDVLSELYGSEVDVIRQDGRVFVAGAPEHRHHPAPTTTATWK
ncbi:metal ABC transporter ATP-binding protein [Actinomyces polynesiensis]|uniref:metal ABC transporter ATP-binding protein n=1 Tax=Actinomyces polynesiensis TaxID=1325934 RepID=UPI0009E65CA1|nr:metal ABC transporter ATP-binding protein [Actinomyces polynesiensis]